MPRIAHRIATTLAIATMVVVGIPAIALAGPPPPTNPTIARANEIMSLDYKGFDALPKNEAPFDWSNDGCSTPWVPNTAILGDFNDDFFRACIQHDFGYANYGVGGLALSPNEDTRGWIDDRLLQEMRRICNNEVSFIDRPICHVFAVTFHTAVRNFGRSAFYS